MSQDLVKALGVTPAEKKASELAEGYAAKQNHTIVSALISEADFKAGFRAALELAEVKGLSEAISIYADRNSWHEFISGGNIGNGQDGDFMQCFDTPNNDDGAVAREALTAWCSFRGESA